MSDVETLRKDLARYGARIGILEPLARSTFATLPELRDIVTELRAAKSYAQADRLRSIIARIEADACYAFPTDARQKWGCK